MIWIKEKLKMILFLIFGGGIVLAAPIVPQDMKWVHSYETIAFETVDGDLGMDEWANAGNGEFYIREVPKDEGQFVAATSSEALLGKTEVKIFARKDENNSDCNGCAYYSEFLTRSGRIVRVPCEGRYNDLKKVRNAPQPKRIERVSVLSADESKAAIAFDAASRSGADISI